MTDSRVMVIAFPGELQYMAEPEAHFMRNDSAWGTYDGYLTNIKKLISFFKGGLLDMPLFLIGDEPDTVPKYINELEPPDDARMLYWHKYKDRGPGRELVELKGKDKVEFDWSDLKNAGIDEVLLGGERTIDQYGTQCAGEIALEMMDIGLEVRGLSGALYPLLPFRNSISPEDEMDRIIKALYHNSVIPPTLIKRTP